MEQIFIYNRLFKAIETEKFSIEFLFLMSEWAQNGNFYGAALQAILNEI